MVLEGHKRRGQPQQDNDNPYNAPLRHIHDAAPHFLRAGQFLRVFLYGGVLGHDCSFWAAMVLKLNSKNRGPIKLDLAAVWQ